MRLAIDIPKQSGIQKNAINEYHWKDFWRTFDGLWHLKLAPYHAYVLFFIAISKNSIIVNSRKEFQRNFVRCYSQGIILILI